MIKGRRRPGSFAVASGAIGRELRSRVVRTSRSRIIGRMAAVAGIRCVVVVAVVAGSTIIGNARMRAVQRIVIVVNGECSRFPARVGGMAHRTIRRNIQGGVIRVGTGSIIGRMATRAGVGRIREIAVVTGIAVVRNGHMRPCKRINRVVVECGRRPNCFCMAQRAIGRKLRRRVVRAGRSRIIGRMTAVAGVRRIVVVAVVAGWRPWSRPATI